MFYQYGSCTYTRLCVVCIKKSVVGVIGGSGMIKPKYHLQPYGLMHFRSFIHKEHF